MALTGHQLVWLRRPVNIQRGYRQQRQIRQPVKTQRLLIQHNHSQPAEHTVMPEQPALITHLIIIECKIIFTGRQLTQQRLIRAVNTGRSP